MNSNIHWTPLGGARPFDLANARIELHWAAQVFSATADALLPHAADDSHTNLFWDAGLGGLIGRELPGERHLGLVFADFALVCVHNGEIVERISLAEGTLEDALTWTKSTFDVSKPLTVRDYEMPAHPVGQSGGTFSAGGDRFAEVGRYFESATAVFETLSQTDERATPIAVWPHHFDLGGILFLETGVNLHKAKQIGFGLSPGDGSIAEPYFYVTPWPIGDSPAFPELDAGGIWQTDGFTGALLLASHLVDVPADAQRDRVERYLRSAISAGEALIRAAAGS